MAENARNFAIVIQEFLNVKSKQSVEGALGFDKCLLAFEIALVQKWVDLPRIVAIVHNADANQSVLFIFAGTRVSETAVNYLTTSHLISLDSILTCESDPNKPVVVKVTGRDLTRPTAGIFDLKKRATIATGHVPKQQHLVRSLTLEFENIPAANQFRTELGIELSRVTSSSSSSLLPPKPDTVDSWLDKYRLELLDRHYSSLAAAGIPRTRQSIPVTSSRIIGCTSFVGTATGHDNVGEQSPNSLSPCSNSSESPVDDDDEYTSDVDAPTNNSDTLPHSVSVPAFETGLDQQRGGTGAMEQGQELIAMVSSSNDDGGGGGGGGSEWETGDCARDESTTAALLQNAGKYEVASRGGCDCAKLSAVNSVSDIRKESASLTTGSPVANQQIQMFTMTNCLPDPQYRSRLSGDPVVKRKLEEDEAAYCTWKTLNLFIGSWNVNGRQDAFVVNLDAWMHPPPTQPPADIYVFGFQELDLNLAGMALNKQTASPLESKWLWLIESSVGGLLRQQPHQSTAASGSAKKTAHRRHMDRRTRHTDGGYRRLAIVRLAGLLLVVYVSNRLHERGTVSEVAVQAVPTGMFNVMGNKGAVGLRLTVYNHSLCFLNCHLAAGTTNCERRNQDYGEIMRKMVFERRSVSEGLQYLRISEHDQVFLFGDLNYRVVGLDVLSSVFAATRGNFDALLKCDELIGQRAEGNTLRGFLEGQITFPPTYKFDLVTNSYYTSEGRIPSYCDRILWRGKFVEQICYKSCGEMRLSDHKPVSAYFKIGARCVDSHLFNKAYEAVIRSQDLYYNMQLPQASLTSQEVELGAVLFEDIRRKTITLNNTGHSHLEFKFTQEGAAAFPSWLQVHPLTARVEKGESCDITFDVYVNLDAVAALQSGLATLSCIIVLTLVGGKDYFISISGRFIPTSFGLPLSLLLCLPDTPVALIPPEELKKMIRDSRVGNWREAEPSVVLSSRKPSNPSTAVVVGTDDRRPPTISTVFMTAKEIYRMADFISARFGEPNLFRQPEIRSDISIIRDTLDTTTHSVPIPDGVSVHSMIYSLLVFLSALPEPVIPYAFQPACLAAVTQPPPLNGNGGGSVFAAYQAISKLPIDYQNLFFYLVYFLKRCLAYSIKNGTDINMLASTFADIILREPPFKVSSPKVCKQTYSSSSSAVRNPTALSHPETKIAFLKLFLSSDTREMRSNFV